MPVWPLAPLLEDDAAVKHLTEMTLGQLYSEFDQMEDWEERCDFLIDLGFELPEMSSKDKIDANVVHGCQSHVWLVARVDPGPAGPVVRFEANSDALIVSGLIAVLWLMYNGKPAREILALDPREVFKKLELDKHLSSSRRNGLGGMVQRIRQFAVESLATA